MKRLRAAFIGVILADVFMLLVAQGPEWVTPNDTSLFLNSNRSDICERVTNLNATSTTGDNVTYTVLSQDPHVGFKVVPDNNTGAYVLKCSSEQIEDGTYIVVVRANYTSGSSNFTDLTLNITFANSETVKDDCAAAPCRNGGNCTNLKDGYSCTCKPGFNGTNCEINEYECEPDLCKNEGKCTKLIDGYNCTCKPGFNGTNCEINIDECASDPCENGGNCTDLIDGYNCTCGPGFKGTNCDIIDGGFSAWSVWSGCSVTCGQGVQTRNRPCNNPAPAGGGMDCPSDGFVEIKKCNLTECQVNGGFSAWSVWSGCSVTCGQGVQTRYRQCNNPAPAGGGMDCPSNGFVEIKKCNLTECQVDGGFSAWSVWSGCSVTCGQGVQTRNRQCNNPAPAGGGMNCPSGGYEERKQCNRKECQVNPTGLCECHVDNYWDGKNCVAKASICSDSCDKSALVVFVVLLTLLVVALVIYFIYLKMKMKRNSGQLAIVSSETPVRTKNQEPKYVNVAYVEDETPPDGQLELFAQRKDVRTPDDSDLDKAINKSNATEDKNDEKPVVQSGIQAKHEYFRTQEESDLEEEEESFDSNESGDEGQNPKNVNGAFAEDGKHPEGQSKIQEKTQDLETQEKNDQDKETEKFNASKDEGNTGEGGRTEDKDSEDKTYVPDETQIRNETQNDTNRSATDDKDNKESASESSETSEARTNKS